MGDGSGGLTQLFEQNSQDDFNAINDVIASKDLADAPFPIDVLQEEGDNDEPLDFPSQASSLQDVDDESIPERTEISSENPSRRKIHSSYTNSFPSPLDEEIQVPDTIAKNRTQNKLFHQPSSEGLPTTSQIIEATPTRVSSLHSLSQNFRRKADDNANTHTTPISKKTRESTSDFSVSVSLNSLKKNLSFNNSVTEDRYEKDNTPSVRKSTIFDEDLRVFAFFKGHPSYYYPATLVTELDNSANANKVYTVRFDDSTTGTVKMNQMRLLEFKEGDTVRVAGRGNANYKVLKVSRQIPKEQQNEYVSLDNKGNNLITVYRLKKEELTVSVGLIYLPPSHIKQFEDRTVAEYVSSKESKATELDPAFINTTPLRFPQLRASTSLCIQKYENGGFFNDCLFVLTGSNSSYNRLEMKNLIKQFGGTVLDDGLRTLFVINENWSKRPLLKTVSRTWMKAYVVSDTYSRKVKYLEGLALNVPCVHFMFIFDSIRLATLLDHSPYMLAAGFSRRLNCCLSQNVTNFVEGESLYQRIKDRRLPLQDVKILFSDNVLSKTSSQQKRAKKSDDLITYMFHAFCLGATVSHVSLSDADDHNWDVIISDLKMASSEPGEQIHESSWITECVISGSFVHNYDWKLGP
ncbi:DNA repair protein RAD9 [Schizosaccharomyces japonicus yFS275]|uniref:DNA repair protein RAD9 n=1 Tax=Schizosaccharomyces japonicus (strain yFS275 / FY16936) TaxID=402676 RepID=B6K016_SCHJY|nr:DNA repair protein RAD9 [Schizosaccharomyces japonicus yFS275]EEB06166.1 DNA repair protein RAD9 [Schizosaccharomyces japonicus yFS275]